MMDEHLRILQVDLKVGRLKASEVTFRDFDACGAPHFFKRMEPIIIILWIICMESAICSSFCSVEAKVRIVECLQHDEARDW